MSSLLFKLILLGDILLGSIAQILLKTGMKNNNIVLSFKGLLPTLIKIYMNKFVFIGSLTYALSTLIWIAVISKIELSYAYPMVSLNFVIVALLSKIFFKEHVSKVRWLSILIIIAGVALLSIS